MKTLPAAMTAHLQSGATTLCWCWRLTRRDGTVQGFTDHDRDVQFDATTFEAAAGFTASEMREQLGLSVDNVEVSGAISSQSLAEADLKAGLYDNAKVEIFRVNWQDTTQRVLLRSGALGEVRRAGGAFAAEVRGLAHVLQQPQGRLYQYGCDADLGDAHCGIDLDQPAYKASGAIATVLGDRSFTATGLGAFASGWCTRGLVRFTSGPAQNQAVEVKAHRLLAGIVTVELWQAPRLPMSPGQTFIITAGCDKALETCRAKFANAVNFRGFPHMPGNDFVLTVARPGRAST
jgi:uncharacterized phage protein (TIGR02218 family)